MEHQIDGEILKILPVLVGALWVPKLFRLELIKVDVEARHGVPEVPPPRGQHARLHRLPGLHEGHDGVEEAVRQGAQTVRVADEAAAGATCTGPLPFGLKRHGFSLLGAVPQVPQPKPVVGEGGAPTGEDGAARRTAAERAGEDA
uniref:Uncharacterized protein n=1 Tax=Arundo donax TaxID=35708 RepID=A0A0A9CYB0_ARUDO